MKILSLDKNDTLLLKGIGILAIAAHNYFHWIEPRFGENEFFFKEEHFTSFLTFLINDPLDFIRLFFSYFGHYGVQLFFFLSAYGLTISYNKSVVPYGNFIIGRLKKLYPAYIIAFLIFLTMEILLRQDIQTVLVEGFEHLFLISNFIPQQALSLVGPWWFIVMIVQFYLVFPFLMAAFKKRGTKLLLILSLLSWLLVVFINPMIEVHGLNVRHFFFGYFPELSLGIYLATKKEVTIDNRLVILLCVLFVLGNMNQVAWSVLSFNILLLSLLLYQILSKGIKGNRVLNRTFLFYGGISFYLFLVHGFLRGPWFRYANNLNNILYTLLLFFVFLIISTIFSLGVKWVDEKIKNRFL